MSLLQMKNICKSFSGVPVLKNVQLTVEKGEVHALLGENGAGKSTLMNVLTGVFPRDKGEIEFDGKELKNITIKQSENLGIAFVHQELNLFNDLKVYENIFLQKEYTVVSLDFQRMSYADFENENSFVMAFSGEILDCMRFPEEIPDTIKTTLQGFADGDERQVTLSRLFRCLSQWCEQSNKKIVLLIDEVDSASNNQVFLDFLAQLRGYYINRDRKATFQSVILAGVHDIKNIKRKISENGEHKLNSPWNIAADYLVDMSFSALDIAGMLKEYEGDHKTGMDINAIAGMIFDYTSGYPFLVSKLCKLIDEIVAEEPQFLNNSWTKEGLLKAVNILLKEKNTLFESLVNKLADYPELRKVIYALLFNGKMIPYNPLNPAIEMAEMFGFIKRENDTAVISNRIFETVLYNYFLSEEFLNSKMYDAALQDKNQFVKNG